MWLEEGFGQDGRVPVVRGGSKEQGKEPLFLTEGCEWTKRGWPRDWGQQDSSIEATGDVWFSFSHKFTLPIPWKPHQGCIRRILTSIFMTRKGQARASFQECNSWLWGSRLFSEKHKSWKGVKWYRIPLSTLKEAGFGALGPKLRPKSRLTQVAKNRYIMYTRHSSQYKRTGGHADFALCEAQRKPQASPCGLPPIRAAFHEPSTQHPTPRS